MKTIKLYIRHIWEKNFLASFLFFLVSTLFLIGCAKTEDTPPATSKLLTVTGAANATTITTNGGTLQLSAKDGTTAVASPTWTVTEIDGSATTKATISSTGLLTAASDGKVRVKAVHSGKEGTVDITISNQTAPAETSLTVTGAATTITTNGGTLQMSAMDGTTAVASPTWTVTEIDGSATTKATISTAGVLTASANGMVRVKAVHSGKEGTLDITISNQTAASTPNTIQLQGMIVGSSGHFTSSISSTTTTGDNPTTTHGGTATVTLDDTPVTLEHKGVEPVTGSPNKMVHSFVDSTNAKNHMKIEVTTTTTDGTTTVVPNVPEIAIEGHTDMKAAAEVQSSSSTPAVDRTMMFEGTFTTYFQVGEGTNHTLFTQHYNIVVSKTNAKIVTKLTETLEQIKTRIGALDTSYSLRESVLLNYLSANLTNYVVVSRTATQLVLDGITPSGEPAGHTSTFNISANNKLTLAGEPVKESFNGIGDKSQPTVPTPATYLHFFVTIEGTAHYYKIIAMKTIDEIHTAAGITHGSDGTQDPDTDTKLYKYINDHPTEFETQTAAQTMIQQHPVLSNVKSWGEITDSSMIDVH